MIAAARRPGSDPRLAPLFWWALAAVLAALVLVPLSRAWALATDLGHGWAFPLVAAYLYWERWESRPSVQDRAPAAWAWLGAALVAVVAVVVRLMLTPYPLWPAAVTLYVLLLAAVALAAAWFRAGWAGVRWVGGPLLILPGVLPWPGQLEQRLILPLREGMAAIAAEISNLIGQPALASGTSVRLGSGWVGIDEACGGIRSLQAAIMAALFLGEWLRFGWMKRIGLIAAGAAAAVLGNFFRVLFLVWRANESEAALHAAHDAAGWLALGVTLALTGAAAWALRRRGADAPALAPAPVATAGAHPGRALPWAAAVVGILLAGDLGTRWWFARGEANLRAMPSQWVARLPESSAGYNPLPLTTEAREMLRPDVYAGGWWNGADQRRRMAYAVEWRTGQVARFIPFLHNPTVCFPASGCEFIRDAGEFKVPWAEVEIPFQAYIFRSMGEEFAVAFTVWDPSRAEPLRKIGEGSSGWWSAQWADVREARQHQPAQMLTYAVYGDDGLQLLPEEIAKLIRPASELR